MGRQDGLDAGVAVGQTTRNVQDARAQLEALKEQGNSGADRPAPATGAGAPAGTPGPGTLFDAAKGQLDNGANSNGAGGAPRAIAHAWPNAPKCRAAQYYVGVSFANDRNHWPRRTRYIRSFLRSTQRVPRRRRRCTSTGFISGTTTRRPKVIVRSESSATRLPRFRRGRSARDS